MHVAMVQHLSRDHITFKKMALKVAFFPLSALQKLQHFESFL
jgi:hypothetical protein